MRKMKVRRGQMAPVMSQWRPWADSWDLSFLFSAGARLQYHTYARNMGEDFGEDTYRPSVFTSCYICFRRLVLRLALAIGSCSTWIRTRWAMAMGNGRGRKLCLVLTVVLLVVIPVAIFFPKGSSGGSTSSLSGSSRYDEISNRIVASGLTPQDILLRQNAPQNKALNLDRRRRSCAARPRGCLSPSPLFTCCVLLLDTWK
jgi:hypothetical protein